MSRTPSRMRPAVRRLAGSLTLLAILTLLGGSQTLPAAAETPRDGAPSAVEARARELEGRLFAPCCWNQTLDIHESEIATSLRREIRARLQAGEQASAVQDALVARFGERLLAVPSGRDPRLAIVIAVGLAMLAAAVWLVLLARRWSRASAWASNEPVPGDAALSAYDARLAEELKRLDG